jgi:hypothetical protein
MFILGAVKLRRPELPDGEKKKFASNVVQAATVLVTVPAAVAWPAYLLTVVPLVVVSRFYYRSRFNVAYPGPARNA